MTRQTILPLYAKIQQFVRDGIKRGTFKPGDRLPSEPSLAKQFKTTRSTVVHALQLLVFEGVITREVGRGTFVARSALPTTLESTRVRSFEEQVEELGATVDYKLVSFSRIAASAEIGANLAVPVSSEIYNLVRLRIVNAAPAVLENRYIPLTIGSMLSIDALSKYSMYSILGDQLGRPVARIDGIIRVAAAVPHVANLLRIKQGSPVLVRDYVLKDVEGEPLICGEAFFREQFPIRYTVQTEASERQAPATSKKP